MQKSKRPTFGDNCYCCNVVKCGKKHGPYTKKKKLYLNNQRQCAKWRRPVAITRPGLGLEAVDERT